MQLPLIQNPELAQVKWKSILDPLLAKPISSGLIVYSIVLTSGVNVINHKLGRTPQGWIITDIDAAITLYRSAAFNPLTLTLTASGSATCSLMVF